MKAAALSGNAAGTAPTMAAEMATTLRPARKFVLAAG